MRSKVWQREERESARVYENSSMHGQALLVVCVFPWFCFVSFFLLRHFLFSCNGLSICFSFYPFSRSFI